jgi:hypothetical protein
MMPRLAADPGLAALFAAVVAAALFAACRGPRAPLRFPHEFHLTQVGCDPRTGATCLNCTSCHAPSRLGGPGAEPSVALCERCHRDQRPELMAVVARTTETAAGRVTFDHDAHLALDGLRGQCVPCHAGVVSRDRPPLPAMSQCFGCHVHEQQWQRAECGPCHERSELARTLPVTFLQHDAAFMRHHGARVAVDGQGALCQTCHSQADCQSCHDLTQQLTVEKRRPERVESRQVHRGDFLVRHSIEARSEPARCLSCHSASTCDGCHIERGVSANATNGRSPHPPEWMSHDYGSSNFHGNAARRDILTCAACHEAGPATNCISCHRVGAYGGNPHPNGWNSARATSSEMCGYCHG